MDPLNVGYLFGVMLQGDSLDGIRIPVLEPKIKRPQPSLDDCGPKSGAGGNRTPVRQAVTVPATTIPDFVAQQLRHRRVGWPFPEERPSVGTFPKVSGLSRRQRSLPAVHPHFCCRAVGVRPRAPLLVTMTLYLLKRIRLRE